MAVRASKAAAIRRVVGILLFQKKPGWPVSTKTAQNQKRAVARIRNGR
jgi:hypothetical protein